MNKEPWEINLAVAEEVMGWKRPPCKCSAPTCGLEDLPQYAEDIAAAWQVVEKMGRDGWHISINLVGRDWDAAFFGKGIHIDNARTWAASAPLAICLAALKSPEPAKADTDTIIPMGSMQKPAAPEKCEGCDGTGKTYDGEAWESDKPCPYGCAAPKSSSKEG